MKHDTSGLQRMDKRRQNEERRSSQFARKNGEISTARLISCYAASLLICILCVREALKPDTAGDSAAIYLTLAAVGVLFSVFITVYSRKAAKANRAAREQSRKNSSDNVAEYKKNRKK